MEADTIINLISCIVSIIFGILSIIFGSMSIKLKIENKKILHANVEMNTIIENKVFGVSIENISKSANLVNVEIQQINQYNIMPNETPSEIINSNKEEE